MGIHSLIDLFEHGGPVMWPLLAASVLALALILDRAIAFIWWHQSLRRVLKTLKPLILRQAWEKAEQYCERRGPYTWQARNYLRLWNAPKEVREDVLQREGTILLSHLETRLRWLATLAQISTLLGLLGTFYFMIYRF